MQHKFMANPLDVRDFYAFHHPFFLCIQVNFNRVGGQRFLGLRGEQELRQLLLKVFFLREVFVVERAQLFQLFLHFVVLNLFTILLLIILLYMV